MSKNNMEDKIKGSVSSDQAVINAYLQSSTQPQHIGTYYPFHQLYGYLYPNTAPHSLNYYNRSYSPYEYFSTLSPISVPFQKEREQLIK